MPDLGVVCHGEHEGKKVLGIRLNFEKRYITLAPVATVVGLAFKLFDPDKLLGGDRTDYGITCALIPRNTPGVTSFVGHGNRPTPLDDSEVKAILKQMEEEAPKVRVSYQVGQAVKITDGPFTDFEGIVDAIDHERGRVRVLVSFFGREAPVELDFLQVTRLVD